MRRLASVSVSQKEVLMASHVDGGAVVRLVVAALLVAAGPHDQRRRRCSLEPHWPALALAGLRPEREDLRPEHVDERHQSGLRRSREPAALERVRDAALRDALPAGKLRLRRRSAERPGRLLHRGRRARRLAERRRRQRDDRLVQPVLRPRQLHGADELLALRVEPDDQRRRSRAAASPASSGRRRRPRRCGVSTSTASRR